MPAGLTLNSETGEISGTPTVKGEFRITISVKNSFGSTSVLCVIRIFDAEDKPVIKTETLPNGGVGSQYYQRIEFKGYNQFYSVTLTGAPSWLQIVPRGASPCLDGTPTKAGTFTFTVNIDNIVGVASKEYTLKINDAPIAPKIEKELFVFNDGYSKLSKSGDLSIVQGKAVDIQFAASGTNTEENPMKWELDGELPPGLVFDTNTGRLTGMVTENVVGSANTKHYYCRFIARNTNSAGSTSIDELYPLVVYKNGWKESVSITPDNTTVQKGGSREFKTVVDGWGDVDQTIKYWYAIGSKLSASTKIDENGILTVGSDETNTEIKVVAITYNGGSEVKGEAVVTIVDHAHNTVKVPAKAKSCTENGNIEHFKCTVCNGLFSDAGAVNSLTEEQVVIAAGHEYGTIVAKVDATCVATGTQAHYECSVCHKLFDESKSEKTAEQLAIAIDPNAHDLATEWTKTKDGHYHVCKNGCTVGHDELKAHNPDRAAATEIDHVTCTTCGYIIAPALGHTHNLTAVPGKGATCTEDGTKTYYACDGCEFRFKDEAGKEELTDESWLIIPKAHRFGEWIEEVSATTESDGVKAHKTCEFCGKHFDKDGNEIENLVIEKLSGGSTKPASGGLSGGAIVGIAVGSVVVAGCGGFAIFWFVIKKKSFTELGIAIKSIFKRK